MTKRKSPSPASSTTTTTDTEPDRERLDALSQSATPGADDAPSPGNPGGNGAGGKPGVSSVSEAPSGGKRGPYKKRPSAPPPLPISREVVKSVIRAPYTLLAGKLGDAFALTDQEAEDMVDPHLALAQELLPEVIKKRPALYSVLFLHSLAIVVRLNLYMKLRNVETVETETAPMPAPPGGPRESSVDYFRKAGKREELPTPSGA